MSTKLSQIYGHQIIYPEDDHIYEFYSLATQIKDPAVLPYGLAKAEHYQKYDEHKPAPKPMPVTPEVRKEFFVRYQAILDGVALPKEQSDLITGEGLGTLLSALAHGRRQTAIVNIPNNYLIPNLPATAIVEVEAVTGSDGVRGIQIGDAPIHLKGILEKRFAWQELVADAGVKGDRNLALQAVLIDEMAIQAEPAEAMLNELLAASKDLLPQFKF
jgi:alpha-galactosidase